MMFTLTYWKDAAERVVAAFASGLVGVLAASGVVDALNADWRVALGVGLGAAVVEALRSLAAAGVADRNSASFLKR